MRVKLDNVSFARAVIVVLGCFQPANSMDNTQGDTINLFEDEEIIEVIDLDEMEPGPGWLKTVRSSTAFDNMSSN